MHDAAPDTALDPIIVFDGQCVLCSANARFVLRHDRHGRFRLAAMQGEAGAALLRQHGIDPEDTDTLIVVHHGKATRDRDAVLAVWLGFGWPWCALGAFRIVPRAIRDTVYRFVARNRYRLFGQTKECFMPDPRWSDRLL